MKTPAYEPELIVKEGQRPFYLSDDGYGTLIAWESCHAYSGGCGKPLMSCNCKGGPKEPYYITRWRAEAAGLVWTATRHAVTSIGSAVGTSVRKALGKDEAVKPRSLSSFIDADVIATVKAASEERNRDADQ